MVQQVKYKRPLVFSFTGSNTRHPVQLIGVNQPYSPKIQFGRAYMPDADSRSELATRMQANPRVPTGRVANNAQNIEQPAPIRAQTIWRSQLSPELQRQLNIGFGSPVNVGRNQPRELPHLESINAPNHEIRQTMRASHVTSVPHQSGQWALRAVTFG